MPGPDPGSKPGGTPPGSAEGFSEIPHVQSWKQVNANVRVEGAKLGGAGPSVGLRDDASDRAIDGTVRIGETGWPDSEPSLDLIGALNDLSIELGGLDGRQPRVGAGVAAQGHAGIADPGEVVPVEQRQRRDAGSGTSAPAIVAARLSGHDEAGRGELARDLRRRVEWRG